MKEFIKKNKFYIIVMFCYSVTTFIIMMFHESWRDEAQAWLIARDLNIIDIIKQMRYEGHPFLWHMILVPFAKLGFPYVTIKMISWLITNISAWIILKKAPFNNILKILLICSSPMLYWYPAVARSYCLIPLAISLISLYYNKRHNKPIQYILSILLLASTHIIMYSMVGILLILFYWEELIQNRKTNTKEEKKKVYISLAIIIIGLLIIVIPIVFSIFLNQDVNVVDRLDSSNILTQIKGSIDAIIMSAIGITDNLAINLIEIIISIAIIVGTIKNLKIGLIAISTAIIPIMTVMTYVISLQRGTSILFPIMFILWVTTQNKKETNKKYLVFMEVVCLILFSLNIIFYMEYIYDDIGKKYSSSKEVAQFINENIEDGATIICTDMPYSSAVIPYVHKVSFWSAQKQTNFSYVTWNTELKEEYTPQEFKNRITNNFDKTNKLYLLYPYSRTEEAINVFQKNGYIKEIFITQNSSREEYVVYKVQEQFWE